VRPGSRDRRTLISRGWCACPQRRWLGGSSNKAARWHGHPGLPFHDTGTSIATNPMNAVPVLALRTSPRSRISAVRVLYSKNTRNGHRRVHGRYIAATVLRTRAIPRQLGSMPPKNQIDIAGRLDGWQKTNDERLLEVNCVSRVRRPGGSETVDSRQLGISSTFSPGWFSRAAAYLWTAARGQCNVCG
jgi:hypothetical protein